MQAPRGHNPLVAGTSCPKEGCWLEEVANKNLSIFFLPEPSKAWDPGQEGYKSNITSLSNLHL